MNIKRPRAKFKKEAVQKIDYRNVSYRLPSEILDDLDKFVNDDMSASKLVSQILRWAVEDLKMKGLK